MKRLGHPANLLHFLVNFVFAILGVAMFFMVLHLASLDDDYNNTLDARDAAAMGESKLQRAARAVCNDVAAGREAIAVWTPDGRLECHMVIAEGGQK